MTEHSLTDEMCKKIYLYNCCEPYVMMRIAYDLGRAEQLEQVEDAWCDALQEEAECGVKFLSENRAADMKHDYPVLTRFGVILDAMRPTTTQEQQ